MFELTYVLWNILIDFDQQKLANPARPTAILQQSVGATLQLAMIRSKRNVDYMVNEAGNDGSKPTLFIMLSS